MRRSGPRCGALFGAAALLASTLALTGAGAAVQAPRDEGGTAVVGLPAPPITFTTRFGEVETRDDLFETEALIIVFATIETLDAVVALQNRLAPLAVAGMPMMVIDIGCFSARYDAARLWEKSGLYVPLRFDDGALARQFGVPGVPSAAIIDAEGRLRYRGGLGATAAEKELFAWLPRELLYGSTLSTTQLPVDNPELPYAPRCDSVRN